MKRTLERTREGKGTLVSSIPFALFHVVPLLAIWTGVTARALVLCVVLYAVRMFAITAGYHRYFSHRSFRANRVVQAALAVLGTTASQKGPLWWASSHRAHHRFADTERDVHSPQQGFWWSHVGWILSSRHKGTDLEAVRDLAAYPELRFIERWNGFGPWALAVMTFLVGGWSGLVVGFFLSTVVLWHATFTVNSLSHTFGTRRYATTDTSRNNPLIALYTFGEGWHNNHHHYQASARQGFYWWELDITWLVLRGLSAVRIVSGLRQPSDAVRASGRIREGAFDLGTFRARWRRAGAAIARSRVAVATPVAAAGSAISTKQASLEAAVHAKRVALEEALAACLHAAEDLTRTARQAGRTARSSARS